MPLYPLQIPRKSKKKKKKKKKDAPFNLKIKKTEKNVKYSFVQAILKIFEFFFQSRPIPGLYLKPFKFTAFQSQPLF